MRRDGVDMLKAGSFSGVVRLQVGSKGDQIDDLVLNGEFISEAQRLNDPAGLYYKVPTLLVSGSDTVHIRVKDESTGQLVDTPIRLLSDARLDLLDASYMIANESIHLGEKFHLRITDADHDTTGERDTVAVKAVSSSGAQTTVTLTETLPHSGVFTATLEPEFIHQAPSTRPSTQPATTQPVTPQATLKVDFGDTITFTYVDDLSLESTSPVTVVKSGRILLGSDAQVASFTKRFKDPEIAVKTRFLMAEALFEMAKEHRKIGEMAQADGEISKGKNILDEAIRDYPNTSLAPQGEYLLANLAQELTNYQEAVGRYATVISNWPDSEYAAESQFKQALCFEKMSKYDQAVEEYVKLTYLYPDSPLVADATIRLGNYYLKNESFKTAGKIFSSFQLRNPTHRLAPQALFLAAQCAYKQADFKESAELFAKTADTYPDEKALRPEAMYWLADSSAKGNDNVRAFRTFKKVTWDYPESQWAKAARGRLTEEVFSRMQEQESQ
jgi:TolA-binding protein